MNWWRRFWHRGEMEEQLDKELRFHLEEHAADLMARGHSPAEARRLARIALGGPEQVKEECRDARGTRWIEDLWQDIRYALRTLRQRPGFAAVALLTLALGTGATTVMFTVIDGVLLKPLPYPAPERLIALHEHTDAQGDWAFSYPEFSRHAAREPVARDGGATLRRKHRQRAWRDGVRGRSPDLGGAVFRTARPVVSRSRLSSRRRPARGVAGHHRELRSVAAAIWR